MLFLTNRFNFKFSSEPRVAQFSPFQKHAEDIQNHRSKLFPDRRRVPGRKMKYIFVIAFGIQFWAWSNLLQRSALVNERSKQQNSLQLKVAPFMQSKVDIEYTISKHRWDLLVKEALGEDFIRQKFIHNRRISWVPMGKDTFSLARSGLGRYVQEPAQFVAGRFVNGYNIKNI